MTPRVRRACRSARTKDPSRRSVSSIGSTGPTDWSARCGGTSDVGVPGDARTPPRARTARPGRARHVQPVSRGRSHAYVELGRARRDDAEDGAAAVASRSERDARGDDDDDDADAVDRGARDDAERRVEPRDAADARASRGAPVRAARALARVRREQVRPRPRSRVRARARDRPSRVGRARVRIVRGSVRERERDGTRVRGDDHRAPARRARGGGLRPPSEAVRVDQGALGGARRRRRSFSSFPAQLSLRQLSNFISSRARARLDRRLAALERADVRLRPDTRAA